MNTVTKVAIGVGVVWLGGAAFFKWRAAGDVQRMGPSAAVDWPKALVWPAWAFKGGLSVAGVQPGTFTVGPDRHLLTGR